MKPSMGVEFTLRILFYMGHISKERKLFLQDNLGGCFRNA